MTLIAGSPMIWDNSFSGPSIRAVILRQLPIPLRTRAVAHLPHRTPSAEGCRKPFLK